MPAGATRPRPPAPIKNQPVLLAIFSGALRFSVRSAVNLASQRPSAWQMICYIEKSVIV